MLQPMVSKAWSASSLEGALQFVQKQSGQMASDPVTEDDMQRELAVPCFQQVETSGVCALQRHTTTIRKTSVFLFYKGFKNTPPIALLYQGG